MQTVSFRNVGPPSTPQEIKRLRREVMDFMRKNGQPIIFRHMWNIDDKIAGLARTCPACYNTVYEQVRNDCPVCFGFGYASVEESPNTRLYIDTGGQIVVDDPGTNIRAPRYGGFSEPYLTWMAEPDVAVDVFRINEQGVMVKTYDAQEVAPWYPKLGDNDLCINVTLGENGFDIVQTNERFQLKLTQQITVRGFGKRGGRNAAGGQTYFVGQSFQMSRAPENSSLYDVEVDPDGLF